MLFITSFFWWPKYQLFFFFLILKLRKLCIPGNLGMGFMVFRISSGYDLLDPDSIVLNILGVCVCACVCTSVRTRTHTCSFVCSFPVSAWTPTETAIWRSLIQYSLSFWRGVINANRIRKQVHMGQPFIAVLCISLVCQHTVWSRKESLFQTLAASALDCFSTVMLSEG